MEDNNVAISAKKIWRIVRIVFFMLRKGISKRKLLVDLNIIMKRGKHAGKAIGNLMFHHNHRHSSATLHDYEFSCSNTPANPYNSRRHHNHHHLQNLFSCTHAPATTDDDLTTVNNAFKVVLEMLNNDVMVEASPMLPGFGFGRSPMVRQLRITDSPFPLKDTEGDGQVDKAAEAFIKKFYNDLKLQMGSH